MKIKLNKNEFINELKWCIDLNYPLEYKGKIFNARLSLKNRKLMAKAIYALLEAHIDKGE